MELLMLGVMIVKKKFKNGPLILDPTTYFRLRQLFWNNKIRMKALSRFDKFLVVFDSTKIFSKNMYWSLKLPFGPNWTVQSGYSSWTFCRLRFVFWWHFRCWPNLENWNLSSLRWTTKSSSSRPSTTGRGCRPTSTVINSGKTEKQPIEWGTPGKC